jgi:hypothetical protein
MGADEPTTEPVLPIYDAVSSDEDLEKEVYTMEDLNCEFMAVLQKNFPPDANPNATDLFATINDCLKLHPFLRSRNSKRFKRFYVKFIVESGYSDSLVDDFLRDVSEDWHLDEILGWNYAEKMTFLEYAWICKSFRRRMRKRNRKGGHKDETCQ